MAEGGDDLSSEQTEKLLQFQDLTGLEDMERCRTLLERHNWDMEVAVQDRFNEEEGRPSLFRDQQREVRTPPVNVSPVDQRVIHISRGRPPQGIMGWGIFIVMLPFRFVYSSLMDILRFFWRLFMPDPRRTVTDPVGDVTSFIQEYDSQFGETHPVFYQGSYSQVLNDAKNELKFLLVYLHGDDHQDTPEFCRSTLGNADVIEFIDARMLFWGCNTNSPEGFRVSQALRENTYPFLALIVLRQNRMTVVARIEGPIGPVELIERLTRVMEDNEASLIAVRADREERHFNRSLREQQDEAYLESLKADQEKEKKKREEMEKQKQELEEAKRREMEIVKKQEEIMRRKEELRTSIPEEPAVDDPDAIKVLVKLPDGTRIERRFCGSWSAKHLYNFVFCHEMTPDDFSIVTNFPRKTLPCQPVDGQPDPPSFIELKFGKSELVFVHDHEA
ncbi:FAS-associated factor 2-like [Lingula anatina]|uniref:FAS-associated factor 2-like n=1 Tax=Lingula anatina TaxID=7574 RepID=A0A1S3IVD3_LINAN|nr:FAS-associated factor 2-like [Lingula anatina]|eukprot:XP_013402150.2 FAS-associated factor 2-like [Lingula anatina]